MSTLFHGGRVHTAEGPADWLLVDDSRVRAFGRGEAPAASSSETSIDTSIDLQGGTLIHAFRDAHVHLPTTGLYAMGFDFRGERRAAAILDAYRSAAAAGGSTVLFGGNFEDPLDEPLLARDLDAAVGERAALLVRADMHSCVVSSALLHQLQLEEIAGVDRDADGKPTGYLREQAAAAAWTWFDNNMTAEQQRDAVRAAADIAYSKGVAEVHEMFVVEWRGWPSAHAFMEIVEELALRVRLFLGTDEVKRVKDLGMSRIGGDYFLDGSFGSHTAWLKDPYLSAPPPGSTPTGISYREDADLYDFFRTAQEADLQVGVHAIGDAAIEQALVTWERVVDACGLQAVKAKRHRIEHFECASDDHIRRAKRLQITASVQPAFDRFWGGTDKLYANRLGAERALQMNRFRSMLGMDLELMAGSDSTVTPLDPFLQMASLREHHVAGERIQPHVALALHGSQPLAEGQDAHLALLDRDPLEIDNAELLKTEVLGTWISGERVWGAA